MGKKSLAWLSFVGFAVLALLIGSRYYRAMQGEKDRVRLDHALDDYQKKKAAAEANTDQAEDSAAKPTPNSAPQNADSDKPTQTGKAKNANKVKPAPRAGPFGLEAGMTLAELQAFGKVVRKPGKTNIYNMVPPKPDPRFDEYILVIGPTTGLCKIGAAGMATRTSRSGKELKAAFDKIDRELQAKYGQRVKRELYKPEHTWNASTEWMVGLLKEELEYDSNWGANDMPPIDKTNHLEWLALSAHPETINEGFLLLVFGFDNLKKCEEEDKQDQNEKEKSP